MHIVHPVVHDGRGDIEAGDALGPGSLNVEVKPHLAPILAGVLEIPPEREQRIGGVSGWWDGHQVLNLTTG